MSISILHDFFNYAIAFFVSVLYNILHILVKTEKAFNFWFFRRFAIAYYIERRGMYFEEFALPFNTIQV